VAEHLPPARPSSWLLPSPIRPVAPETKNKRGDGRVMLELESTPDILAASPGIRANDRRGFRRGEPITWPSMAGQAGIEQADVIVATTDGRGSGVDTRQHHSLYCAMAAKKAFPRMPKKSTPLTGFLTVYSNWRRAGREVPATQRAR